MIRSTKHHFLQARRQLAQRAVQGRAGRAHPGDIEPGRRRSAAVRGAGRCLREVDEDEAPRADGVIRRADARGGGGQRQ